MEELEDDMLYAGTQFFSFFLHKKTTTLCWYPVIPCRRLGSPYQGKAQQPLEQGCLFLSEHVVFSCVQTMVWLPAFEIFSAGTVVDACDCTQGAVQTR